MNLFDGKRLPASAFRLDAKGLRAARYSDKYFYNIALMLRRLSGAGYRYSGSNPAPQLEGMDLKRVAVGDVHVEMQWFPRRKPRALVAGVDKALAILQAATGYFDSRGKWVSTYKALEVWAAPDGSVADYGGDPMKVTPVLKVRGRYRDFAVLETPTIGALTRASRIATNVYEVLEAARGRTVLFFPARFDAHELQADDGYAYHLAVQRYNQDYAANLQPFVSTDAQAQHWEGRGGGTVAHAAISSFLGDLPELMLQFAATLDPDVPRIALVDFHNDCIRDSVYTMKAMFSRWMELTAQGRHDEARRYKLVGVRPDTAGELRDFAVSATGDPHEDFGVTPRLVFAMREAMDNAWKEWNLPVEYEEHARKWCREVKIVATGGFTPQRIRWFEERGAPVDIYGVGSHLLSNCKACGTNTDYTADVVRVRIGRRWVDLAKVGRQACENPALERVQ